jgi:hypothetical protein
MKNPFIGYTLQRFSVPPPGKSDNNKYGRCQSNQEWFFQDNA